MVARSSPYYNLGYTPILPPAAARTAAFTSASVDTQNFDSLAIVASVGASGDTLSGTNRIELALQESDDNAAFTPVGDADLLKVVAGQAAGTFAVLSAPAAANQAYVTGYRGNKRYVRLAGATYGTTTNGTFVSAMAVAGGARNLPVNI